MVNTIKIINKIFFLPLSGILFIVACQEQDESKTEAHFLGDSHIVFASQEESGKLLSSSDEYSQALSPFDVQARIETSKLESEEDYLAFAGKQAQEWTAQEIKETTSVIADAESKIRALGLKLNLPKEIKLIKTTSLEEGGAQGYTRSNFIVLKGIPSLHIFLHELFHIYSRANPEKQDPLYETINFTRCNRITFPESIKNQKMTNPDAPFLDHFLTTTLDGVKRDVVFITYSDRAYNDGGKFFEYLTKRLMIVEGNNNTKSPVLSNGEPILKEFYEAPELLTPSGIGLNTIYNLHPEEVLAEHFSLMVIQEENIMHPSFLKALKQVLTE